MKIKRIYVLTAAVLAANAFLAAYFLNRPAHTHLVYGDRFPALSATDLSGHPVRIDHQWSLIQYAQLDSPDALRNVRYLDVLFREHKDRGLRTFAIVEGDASQARPFLEISGLSYPILLDANREWQKRLALERHSSAAFFVDAEGIIRFAATEVQPDDLRQLAEKFLLGRVSYSSPQRAPLSVGETLPSVWIEDVRRSVKTDLRDAAAGRPLIVFTARCPTCSLDAYMAAYSALEGGLSDGAPLPVLLFSSTFATGEVAESGEKHKVRARLCVALNGIPGIEDEYYMKNHISEDVLIINSKSDGRVDALGSFADFRRVMRGK